MYPGSHAYKNSNKTNLIRGKSLTLNLHLVQLLQLEDLPAGPSILQPSILLP